MPTTTNTPRCFGYTPAGDVVDHEATVIRGVVASVLSGQMTLRQVVAELNDHGITTTTGGRWQVTPLVRLLTNPRLAGLTPKARGSAEKAPPILTVDQHNDLVRQARARRSPTPHVRAHTNPSRLLSGLVFHDADGQLMTGHVNNHGPSYRCPAGHCQIQAELLERYVSERAVWMLTHGPRPIAPQTPADLAADLADLSRYRTQVTGMRNARVITVEEAEVTIRRIKKRRTALRARIEHLSEQEPLVLPEPGHDVQHWWDQATPGQRRAVIAGYFQQVEISEPTRNASRWDRIHLILRRELTQLGKAS